MDDLTGQTIKGYQLGARISEGGFGAVYRAYQPIVEREVAIKVILREYASQPQFIRRFEFEARLIAQLEHPHIVPLYDYWRDPGGAYLVMRSLRTSLRDELKKGPWTPEATSRLLDQIASALMVAHRHGVIHRDIKPDNILLDGENNAFLADFGIAISPGKALSEGERDDGEIGSVGYVTPEQIRGEPLSSQTDLYSLGIVLYEMLAGRRPFADELSITELIEKQLHDPLPPLDWTALNDFEALNAVIQRATQKNPEHRFVNALSMAAAFRQARSARSAPPVPDSTIEPENPYKGLRAFGEADAADFYGREALIQRLLSRLGEGYFLAVIGPSGSGKSSVVRAGLLPALRRGLLPGSENWYLVEIRPGADPFQNLETALLSVAGQPVALRDALASPEDGILQAVRAVLPTDGAVKLLIVIDQFEEVFTLLEDEAERLRFLNSLSSAVKALAGRLSIVVTLRADFLDRPLLYADFGDLIRRYNEFVLPLSSDELRRTIIRPAERAGVTLETDLIEALVQDVEDQPGALPLLQYALTELFEQRQGRTMTLSIYQTSGGVLGTLGRNAEALYRNLTLPQQAAARQVFLRLITLGEGMEDTRRRTTQEELATLTTDRQLLDSVIEAFSKNRLLTFDRDPATRLPTVEIAHEALIRTWTRLREWLAASREDLRLQRRLLVAANEWLTAGRETSFLASGVRLDQFESWAKDSSITLNRIESQFLEASIAERDARSARDQARIAREQAAARLVVNFRRATIILGIVGVLAAIGIVVLAIQAASAVTEVNRSNNLVATAQTQVAFVAQTLTPIPVTLTAVSHQIEHSQRMMEVLRLASESNKLLFSNSGNVETAALLSIRALKSSYLAQADTALRQSLEHNYTQHVFGDNRGAVYGVAFSPDGLMVLTGSADGLVKLRYVQTGNIVQTFVGHSGPVNCVAFSPDGQMIVTGGKDTTARLWDVRTGRTLHVFGTRISPVYQSGHTSSINSVAFSPDGHFVLTSSRDRSARLWNVQTGEMLHAFRDIGAIWSIAFSPDGKYFVGSSRNNAAMLWDITSGKIVRALTGHTGNVWSVAYSPDGNYVLTGSGDNTARLWDVQTGKTLRTFTGHEGVINSVAFAPDGKHVLTGSDDNTARLWDAETGQVIRVLTGHNGSIWSVAFSADGASALTGGDDRVARTWNVSDDSQPFIFASHSAAVWKAVYSSDGKLVLTAGDDGVAELWDVRTRQKLHTLSVSPTPIYVVAFSPDARYSVTAGADNIARLWDTQTGALLQNFTGPAKDNSIYAVAFSPNGDRLLTAGTDITARLWDIATNGLLQTFSGHKEPISGIAFSPDGKTILTASNDNRVLLWSVATGRVMHSFDHTDDVLSIAVSPDGKTILTGSKDSVARLWDTESGQLIRSFAGHSNAVSGVAFSPDGKTILTGSFDATVRVWDATSGRNLRIFAGFSNSVSSVAFSPDGKMVLASSVDKTVRQWEADYHDFITYACKRLSRDFTDDERLRYLIPDKQPTCPQFVQ